MTKLFILTGKAVGSVVTKGFAAASLLWFGMAILRERIPIAPSTIPKYFTAYVYPLYPAL